MRIEDLPVLEISEPINPNGGCFELDEGEEVPGRAVLRDTSGKTLPARIQRPIYLAGMMQYSYSALKD